MRSWSGWSLSAATVGQVWKVTVPRLAAQTIDAGLVGRSASPVRPEGNVIRVESMKSGRFFGRCFW
ncbi:Uncharacterised protein [Mycobacteroides abscessus subsp. abscessus]|nr:Uncharacterised protein [Mycobacteroides abscessus subsp. abscessus]